MRFYEDLYVGASVTDPGRVKWKLLIGAGQFHLYLIALSATTDQLDIFHCAGIKQKYFDRKHLTVVGLAGSIGEAYGLVEQMAKDSVSAGMDGDIKGYLLRQMKSRKAHT